ncbi:hypothetical membrane protein [Candida dubliniensis CD36]|uniref:Hypothetical membrane protein n=1 Tax=Candida dubliniensis (strain CD36 / ATCC MYA-646 / CBS 7987 / NCPF 3949 / NRRL Y-17841) TaxID=573826 RepID=B9WAI8_CANDC|nr:hypothetical membrane protein [Candida dubliniensis CD36]CAX43408.1 hypothetical membrane protein [Candida dubliniensis CD36]
MSLILGINFFLFVSFLIWSLKNNILYHFVIKASLKPQFSLPSFQSNSTVEHSNCLFCHPLLNNLEILFLWNLVSHYQHHHHSVLFFYLSLLLFLHRYKLFLLPSDFNAYWALTYTKKKKNPHKKIKNFERTTKFKKKTIIYPIRKGYKQI